MTNELFSERRTGCELRNSLRKLNLALVIAVPYCAILFLKVLGRLDHIGKIKKEVNHALVTFDSHSAILYISFL